MIEYPRLEIPRFLSSLCLHHTTITRNDVCLCLKVTSFVVTGICYLVLSLWVCGKCSPSQPLLRETQITPPLILQTEQVQLSQPVFAPHVLQPTEHLGGHPLRKNGVCTGGRTWQDELRMDIQVWAETAGGGCWWERKWMRGLNSREGELPFWKQQQKLIRANLAILAPAGSIPHLRSSTGQGRHMPGTLWTVPMLLYQHYIGLIKLIK